jgi:hypothetical protein
MQNHFYRCAGDAEYGHWLEYFRKSPILKDLVGLISVGASLGKERKESTPAA